MPHLLIDKRIFLAIIFLIMPFLSYSQCPAGDILLETQEQVDQFVLDYPDCTQVNSNLTIKEWDVTNISFLEKVTDVGGNLTIHQTNATDLPLHNMVNIGGNLVITKNEYITEIEMENINSIGGGLEVFANYNLEEFRGFKNITTLDHISISHNDNVKAIPKFNNLQSLTNSIHISENERIKEILGFNSLTCAVYIRIHGNDDLEKIDGFPVLHTLEGWVGGLFITINSSLLTISGFESLEKTDGFILEQNGNANLGPGSYAVFPSLRTSGYIYLMHSNFPVEYKGFENVIKVGGIQIDGLRRIESFTGFNKIETAAYITISNNGDLKSLLAFEKLQETQTEFVIKRSENLQEITELKNFTKIGYDFGLGGLAIKNFDFIRNLKEIGDTYSRFDLGQLPNLQDCSGLSNLVKYGYLQEPIDIQIELSGCSSLEEIAASADTDKDGILDVDDIDDDGDGLTDIQENGGDEFLDTDGDFLPDHVDLDSDNDGCLDKDEGLLYFQEFSLSPVIKSHPEFSEIEASGNIDFVVEVENADAFQWQLSTDNGDSWENLQNDNNYNNTTGSTLKIKNTPATFHNNIYRLQLRNTSNSCMQWVTSRFASLVVKSNLLGDPGEDTELMFCPSEGKIDLFPLMNGTPDKGGQWSPALASGGSVFDTSVDKEGVYQYSFKNNNCQIEKASISVYFEPVPTAGLDGNLTICKNGNPVDLFEILNGEPSSGGTWSPALAGDDGVFDPQLDSGKIYTYTVNPNGCAPSTAEVQINLIEEELNAGEDVSIEICENQGSIDLSDYLSADAYPGGSWPSDLTREGFFDPNLDIPGDYIYTVSINGCGTDEALYSIKVNKAPNPGVNSEIKICADMGSYDLFESLGGDPDEGGIWNPTLSSGTGSFDPKIDKPGAYTYIVENNSCGKMSAELNVLLVSNPNTGEDAELEICANSSAVNLFNLLGSNTETGGKWYPDLSEGGNMFNPKLDNSGVYEYRIETETCGSYSSFVNIYVDELASTGASTSISLCENSPSFDLFELLGEDAEKGGVWSPMPISNSGIYDPGNDSPGSYTYTIDQGKCGSSSSTIIINLDGSEVIDNYEIKTSEFEDASYIEIDILETGEYEYSLDGINYSSLNRFSGIKGGEYSLFVKEINGCGYLNTTITLLDYDKFFTPNGDGINDFWKVTGFEGELYEIFIYDRYGKLLKVLSSLDKGWDGNFNGKPMPSDDYWFHLELENGKVYENHFSLVRA